MTDDILDVFLLLATQLIVAPPNRALVLALEVEMSARLARWLAFVALFPAQATCEAAYTSMLVWSLEYYFQLSCNILMLFQIITLKKGNE